MKVIFRFVDNNQPTGFYGIAVAKKRKGIFDVIDEFGDPLSTQLIKLPKKFGVGVCMKITEYDTECDTDEFNYQIPITETATHIEITENTHFVRFFSDGEKIIDGKEFFYYCF